MNDSSTGTTEQRPSALEVHMRNFIHQQKLKLHSENGPDAPIVLDILQTQSKRLICNRPPEFEAFNDIIASSLHRKTC
jgi:hypothetical protein